MAVLIFLTKAVLILLAAFLGAAAGGASAIFVQQKAAIKLADEIGKRQGGLKSVSDEK